VLDAGRWAGRHPGPFLRPRRRLPAIGAAA
jgi:hypothetical protein